MLEVPFQALRKPLGVFLISFIKLWDPAEFFVSLTFVSLIPFTILAIQNIHTISLKLAKTSSK